jgi:hypothetical protein
LNGTAVNKLDTVTPSPEATKKFVCVDLPKIMADLYRKGKLPAQYGSQPKVVANS